MQTFILATKLSPDSARDTKVIRDNGRKWMEAVNRNCPEIKWIQHFALFGQYDFISVYEAPDLETAVKVSVISMSLGALKAESWPAIPYQRFGELLESIT